MGGGGGLIRTETEESCWYRAEVGRNQIRRETEGGLSRKDRTEVGRKLIKAGT